ncbi:MAG TPA: MFS transporter [Pseudonocardiaceae bacterium]|nr:MFS transporter [Pseudonocardiaceae bacterium]
MSEGNTISSGGRPGSVGTTPPVPSVPVLFAVVVLLAGEFLAIFDISVVNVVLPVLQTNLHASSSQAYLVVACYGLTYASLLVMGGRLGDGHGFRRVFLVGVTVFGLASVACGLAPTMGVLIVARAVQGIGSALLFPQVLAGIRRIVPPALRGRAVGAFGAVLGLGSTVGQLGGGLLTQLNLAGVGWRSAFLVNVPVCLVVMLVARRVLPAQRAAGSKLDLPGAVLLAATLTALVLPWSLDTGGLGKLDSTLAVVAVVALGAAFLWWERRVARSRGAPLLDFGLVRQPAFGIGLVLCLMFFGTQVPFYVILSQTAQRAAGLGPLASAELYAGLGIAFLLTSMLAGRVGTRSATVFTILGPLLMAASYLGLRAVSVTELRPGSALVTLLLVVNGLGAGLVAPTLIRYVLSDVRPELSGLASGLLATAQQIANSVGVVVAGAVFQFGQHGTDILAGFRITMWYFVALAVASIVLSAAVAVARRTRRSSAAATQP